MFVDDCDDDISNSSDNSNESGSGLSSLKFGDSLFLHPNDTSVTLLIYFKLTGTDNFKVCSCAMIFALRYKNILGFNDGTYNRKYDDPVLVNQWDLYNYVVVTKGFGLVGTHLRKTHCQLEKFYR